MKYSNEIIELKKLAKRYARANRIALHQSLDWVAANLGLSHWNALVTKGKEGWQPSSDDFAKIETLIQETLSTFKAQGAEHDETDLTFGHIEHVEKGKIGEHTYQLTHMLGDVMISGDGWALRIPEAPNAAPIVEIAKQGSELNPINNLEFREKALRIASELSQNIRANISTDWPRRSTKPDSDGRVRHPLGGEKSKVWYCLHCDSQITGQQIADSMWHCPTCDASPLDISATPFMQNDQNNPTRPIQESTMNQKKELRVELLEDKLKLVLNEQNISLLIRCALLEDATNTNERIGALRANICVGEDNDILIVFDEDLWPESKPPLQAYEVAKTLGVEIDEAITCMTAPFAWPGLGEVAASTSDYTKLLLDAYKQHGTITR